MGTYYRNSNPTILGVNTSRLVVIGTIPTLIQADSTTKHMFITGVDQEITMAWGDSGGILQGSGGVLVWGMTKEFNNVTDGFQVYLIANSAQGKVFVNELY